VIASSTSFENCCAQPGDFTVSRYLADGGLDTGFGNGGRATLAVRDVNEASALALAPDDSIVLAGETASAKSCKATPCTFTPVLARFNSTGALDPAFGGGGWSTVGIPGGSAGFAYQPHIAALAISPSGQILAAGGSGRFSDGFVIAREPNGQANPSFGNDGALDEIRPSPSSAEANGLAIGPKGEIFTTAWSNASAHEGRSILLGFRSNGGRDRRIGSGSGFASTETIGGLHSDAYGHLYTVSTGVAERAYAARFDSRGARDRRYGLHGTARIPASFIVGSFLARPDGRLLIVGHMEHHSGMAAFELTSSGHPDHAFGHRGLAFVDFGSKVKAEALAVAVDSHGRIVLAGRTASTAGAALARLLPDGRLDRSFARRGRLQGLPTPSSHTITITPQPGGGVLLAAGPEPGRAHRVISLLRLDRDGVRDRSFGHAGVLRVRQAGPLISLFSTRRTFILLTGRGAWGEGGVTLHSYRANGTLDRRFGQRGVVAGGTSQARRFRPLAAARQPNGRIVVAGTAGAIEELGSAVEVLRFR